MAKTYQELTQSEKSALAQAVTDSSNDYKCICNLFFFGAWDTNGLLVPYSGDNRTFYEEYRTAGASNGIDPEGDRDLRPNTGHWPGPDATILRIDDYDTPLNILYTDTNAKPVPEGTNGANSDWRLHPSMSFLKSQWELGKVAFIQDIGVLKRTTTKDQFLGTPQAEGGLGPEEYTPNNLYSHIDQRDIIMKGVTDHYFPFTSSGWSGRTAEYLLNSFNVNTNIKSQSLIPSFLVSGDMIQASGPSGYFPISIPAQLLDHGNSFNLNYSDHVDAMNKMAFRSPMGNPSLDSNLLYSNFATIFNIYADDQQEISTYTKGLPSSIKAIFKKYYDDANEIPYYKGVSAIVSAIEKAALAIYNRTSTQYNQNRQIINVSIPGAWDMHSSLRHDFDINSKGVDYALQAFIEVLQHPDMNDGRSDGKTLLDEVIIQTQSDFGRTLDGNGANGADHGWAGHQFIIGNMVNGGIYPEGYTINYDRNGPKSDDSGRVRMIPEVSVLQSYAKILNWFGIPVELLHHLLPGLPYFTESGGKDWDGASAIDPSKNLDFVFASGNYTLNFI